MPLVSKPSRGIIDLMRRDPVYTERARDLRKSSNDAEKMMWSILRAKRMGGFKFRRQHALGQYIADFICLNAKLVIEVDGDTHGTDEKQALDAKRTEFIEKLGYRVVRFWNNEVLTLTTDVADAIARELGLDKEPAVSHSAATPRPTP